MSTAYGLTQTEIAFVLIALVGMLTFWSTSGIPLIKHMHYGNRKMFTFGLISMSVTLASLMVVGAPYSVTACPAAAGSATASYSVCR